MEEAKIWSTIKIKSGYHQWSRHLGSNVAIRNNQRMKQVLTMVGCVTHDRRYINSKEPFKSFLLYWYSKENLKSKMRTCWKMLTKMTRKMKDNILANARRVEILKEDVWDKVRDRLMLTLTKKGSTKKQ